MSLVQCDQKHFVANTDNGFVVGLKCITSFFIKTFLGIGGEILTDSIWVKMGQPRLLF